MSYTCNLYVDHTAPNHSSIPDDPAAITTGRWDDKLKCYHYQLPCGFGTTDDPAAFEQHLKDVHKRTWASHRRTLRKVDRRWGGTSGWDMRPAFRAQTDKPFSKYLLERMTECPECGAWVENTILAEHEHGVDQ